MTTDMQKRRIKIIESSHTKINATQTAFGFARELIAINTPKNTVARSLMASYGMNCSQARELYQKAAKKPYRHHLSRSARA